MMRIKVFALFVCASFLLAPTVWANTPASVVAKIELLEVNENDQISVSLKFTLKNESDDPVEVLTWGTPFEGDFTQDMFNITTNGERVPYIGKLVKRLPPQAEDFIEIAGKSELSEVVYLEDGYKIYAPGIYSVQFAQEAWQVKAAPQEMKQVSVKSGDVDFEIIYGISEDAAADQTRPLASCSSSQMDAANAGLRAARNMATVAKNSLHNAPVSQRPQARRYLEWFGAYDGSRYSQVTSHFNNLHHTLFNEQISVSCNDSRCQPSYFAFVYPSRPYVIYLCNQYWRTSTTGTDSKGGVFIHELTHFPEVFGSDDYAYGQSNCRSLARNNPNAAIQNGDSHEYFAENTPPLSMPTGGGGGGGDDEGGGGGCLIQSLK